MTDMHSFAAAYALDALEVRDRGRFEAHLELCGSCASEVAGFAATAARLAEAVRQTPPTELRSRLLGAVLTTSQERSVVTELSRHRRLRRAIPRLAIAAIFVVGTAAAGGFAVERNHARDNQVATDSISAVLAAPDASTRSVAFARGGNARLVSSATRDVAVIVANDLPRLPKGSIYQVWLIKDEVARSQGTFMTGGTKILRHLRRADRVAVTVEPSAGSPEPSTVPVVAWAI